jgi:4,5-dihydroxyphthalate decarboxylase
LSKLRISLACCDYDRTRALFDGRVAIEGCDITPVPLEPEEAFHRAFRFAEFDVSELSMSSHTLMTSRGQNAYIGIPAFVSRLFRHSGIYIRTDRGIRSPQDFKGKRIGVPEYQMTANVWIRGMFEDEHGIKPTDIHWRQGGLEEPGRGERTKLSLTPEIDFQPIPHDETLNALLARGEIDGLIGARAPSCFLNGAPHVGRLYPDYRAAEEDYFRRTKLFPIMHIIGIRRELVEAHSWLAASVMKAFVRAKALAMAELGQIGHLFVSLPWSVAEYARSRELMGENFWSYGFEPNRHVLEAFTRYHHAQGLSARRVAPEELFAASSLDLSKI